MKAISIIENEHRSLAAVLHGMLYLVHDIRDHGTAPDFDLLGAMIYYIDAFPERYHHPKEDRYLFRALRSRCPEAEPLLDRLEGEHAAGARKIRDLEQLLARYQHGGASRFAQFLAAVEDYADFHWKHMRAEEEDVLPLARKHLLGRGLGGDRRGVPRSRRSDAGREGRRRVSGALHPHRQSRTATHRRGTGAQPRGR